MVLGCDLVVACEEASFGLPEALVGRMPLDGGMTLLQRQVPFRRAMAMLLAGKRASAAEALAMGLVNEVVPRRELDAAIERWVDAVLACAPLSVQAIKEVVRHRAKERRDADRQGIHILNRRNRSFDDACDALVNHLFNFCQLSRRQRIEMRNRTERLGEQFDWSTLARHYDDAHNLALERIGAPRQGHIDVRLV